MTSKEFSQKIKALSAADQNEALVIALKDLEGTAAGNAVKEVLKRMSSTALQMVTAPTLDGEQRAFASGILQAVNEMWGVFRFVENLDLMAYLEAPRVQQAWPQEQMVVPEEPVV